MVNIAITTACQKHCSFCFAASQQKTRQQMSIADFKKVMSFMQASKIPRFNLLGGEPTLHPGFVEIVALIKDHKLQFTLVTNGFVSDDEIFRALIDSARSNTCSHILLNIAELNTKYKRALVYNFFQKLKTFTKITGSITLDHRKSVGDEIQYVSEILNDLPGLTQIRLSVDFPESGDVAGYLVNNRQYGKKILKILSLCAKKNIMIISDCVMYPCLFKVPFRKFVNLARIIVKFSSSCDSSQIPLDILPDLSYIHCYSARQLGGADIFLFKSMDALLRDLKIRKTLIQSRRVIPEDCLTCTYFKRRKCKGPCLGCWPEKKLLDKFAKPIVY